MPESPQSLQSIQLEAEDLTKDAVEQIGRLIVDEATRAEPVPKALARKKVSPALIKNLAMLGAPVTEIAAHANCSVSTVYRRFGKVLEEGQRLRNFSLRRAQFKTAILEGDSQMQRWLGIQWLGQSNAVQVTGPDGGPIQVHHEHDFRSLTREQLLEQARSSQERIFKLQAEITPLLAASEEAREPAGAAAAGSGPVDGDSEANHDSGRAPQPVELHPGEQT